MFREMRRKRQEISQKEVSEVLERGESGVLALSGDEGYPYAVPLNYLYDGGKLYFHGAKSGHKVDAVRRNAKASFCVVDQDEVVPEQYTTRYRSVIAFGRIRIVEDEGEKRRAIEKFALRFAPNDSVEHREKAIRDEWDPLCLFEMTIDHVTGKVGRLLLNSR